MADSARSSPRLGVAGYGLAMPRLQKIVPPDLGGATTLRELAEHYLTDGARGKERSRRLAPESVSTYRKGLAAASRVDGLLEVDLREVAPGWAQQTHDLLAAEIGGATADKFVKLMKAAWNYYVRRGVDLPPCPWTAIDLIDRKREDLVFPHGWLARFLDVVELAAGEAIPAYAAEFFYVTATGGLRPWCETLRLVGGQVDRARGLLVLSSKRGKNEHVRTRSLPLDLFPPRARSILVARAQIAGDRGHLWQHKSGSVRHMHQNTLWRKWAPLREFAQAQGLRMTDQRGDPLPIYALRHAFASRLDELGIGHREIAQLLGHRDQASARYYIHQHPEHLARICRRAAAGLTAADTRETMMIDQDQLGLSPDRLKRALDALAQRNIPLLKPGPDPIYYGERAKDSWVAGDRQPKPKTIHAIAVHLGVSVGWLFGEGPDELPKGAA